MKMPRVCLVSEGKMHQVKRNIPAVRVLSGFQRARLIWTDFISVLRSVSARNCVLRHTLLMTPIIIWCGFDLIHVVALAFQYSVQTTSSMTGLCTFNFPTVSSKKLLNWNKKKNHPVWFKTSHLKQSPTAQVHCKFRGIGNSGFGDDCRR